MRGLTGEFRLLSALEAFIIQALMISAAKAN